MSSGLHPVSVGKGREGGREWMGVDVSDVICSRFFHRSRKQS